LLASRKSWSWLSLLLLTIVLTAGCLSGPEGGSAQATAPTAVPATLAEEPRPPKREFTLIAVGDVMLDRNVWKAIERSGYRSILEKVRDDVRSADITFGNLECPLSTVGPHSPSKYLLFRADPRSVQVLVDGGFDIVCLANNHTLNAGTAGLLKTLDHLEEAGVAYCGAHRDRDRAWEPCRFIVNDLTLGFIAATDLSFEHGSCCKVDEDLKELKAHVAAAAEQCDLLVVSFHWGNEYEKRPTQRQRAVARAAVEAGADLIIGHHPHTLQGIGSHRGVPILYSCGNFVFDQREGERMESAIFHLRYAEAGAVAVGSDRLRAQGGDVAVGSDRLRAQGGGWRIRVVPIWIPRSRMGPIYPGKERSLKIIRRMAQLSENLGVHLTVQGTEGEAMFPPHVTAAPSAAEHKSADDMPLKAATEQPDASRASLSEE